MMPTYNEDREFRTLLSERSITCDRAPNTLKARLYSALIREQQSSGPLASLNATEAANHGLCVFEKLVQITPIPEQAKSPFFCRVCHARILAEHLERPPIFWPHCPYVSFKNS